MGRWDQLETNQGLNMKATFCTGELGVKGGGSHWVLTVGAHPLLSKSSGCRESGSGRLRSPWEEAQHQIRNTYKPKHPHLNMSRSGVPTNSSLIWRYLLDLWFLKNSNIINSFKIQKKTTERQENKSPAISTLQGQPTFCIFACPLHLSYFLQCTLARVLTLTLNTAGTCLCLLGQQQEHLFLSSVCGDVVFFDCVAIHC